MISQKARRGSQFPTDTETAIKVCAHISSRQTAQNAPTTGSDHKTQSEKRSNTQSSLHMRTAHFAPSNQLAQSVSITRDSESQNTIHGRLCADQSKKICAAQNHMNMQRHTLNMQETTETYAE